MNYVTHCNRAMHLACASYISETDIPSPRSRQKSMCSVSALELLWLPSLDILLCMPISSHWGNSYKWRTMQQTAGIVSDPPIVTDLSH